MSFSAPLCVITVTLITSKSLIGLNYSAPIVASHSPGRVAMRRQSIHAVAQFAPKLISIKEQVLPMTIYTPELLASMLNHQGDHCAFPECREIQRPVMRNKDGTIRKNQRKNPFHACATHERKIRNALHSRKRDRREVLREAGIVE